MKCDLQNAVLLPRMPSAMIVRRNAASGRKKLLYLPKPSRNRLVRYMLCCFVLFCFHDFITISVVLRFASPALASGLGCEITTYVDFVIPDLSACSVLVSFELALDGLHTGTVL